MVWHYAPRWAIILAVLAGCRSTSPTIVQRPAVVPSSSTAAAPNASPAAVAPTPVVRVAHQEPLPAPPPGTPPAVDTGGVDGELSLDELLAAVEGRNASLAAMVAAWQAAANKYPQAVALDDPMFMAMGAPASFGSPTVESAYVLELRQRIPWHGKRPLRGEVAQQAANATYHEYEDARLMLRQVVQAAYYDYFLATRQEKLVQENREAQEQFRETAQARYRNNQTTIQDVLQADVELADLSRRAIEVQRQRKTSTARINVLLGQDISTPLPPAHASDGATPITDSEALRHLALTQRQDLAALSHRVQEQEAELALAYKQFYPDVDLFGRYDSFWQPVSTQSELRGQVGVSFNLPVYRHKLNAAVNEASARLNQRRAEYEQKQADIELEVETAFQMTKESEQLLVLYREKLLPTLRQNVEAVRANYEAGKATFLDLAQANRQLIMMRERELEARAAYYQRRSELDRVVGVSLAP